MSETRFVKWSAKEIQFNNWWSVINFSINKEDFNSLPDEKWYVKMVLCKKKEVDQWGWTHFIKLNDWKPEEKVSENKVDIEKDETFWEDESLPF